MSVQDEQQPRSYHIDLCIHFLSVVFCNLSLAYFVWFCKKYFKMFKVSSGHIFQPCFHSTTLTPSTVKNGLVNNTNV